MGLRLKGLLSVVLFGVVFGMTAYSQDGATPSDMYSWDSSRMDVGYFYHYVCSDMDGKGPYDVYYYVTSTDEWQSLMNLYPINNKSIMLSTYKANTKYCWHESISFTNLLPSTDGYLWGKESFDYNTQTINFEGESIDKSKKKSERNQYALTPYAYQAREDGSEFNFYFRQTKKGTKKMPLVYADPFRRTYDMMATYQKDESFNGILCEKYEITGKGALAAVGNRNGALWIAKNDPYRYLVKQTMNMRRNWEYASQMTILKERKPMSPEQWKQFQDDMVLNQKQEL